MYGTEPGKASFANNCLLARRLVERGVRFVQLYHWGWDSHGTGTDDDLLTALPEHCKETDQAGRRADQGSEAARPARRDAGHLGRRVRPHADERERNGSKFLGRDHHPHAFTIWMAGGGIKRGITYGETDELGYHVAEDKVHVHDLQATILHCMGLDHEKLTYKFQGRHSA